MVQAAAPQVACLLTCKA